MKRNKITKLLFASFMAISLIVIAPDYSFAKEEAGTGGNMQEASSNWTKALKASDTDHTTSCLNTGADLTFTFNNLPCSIDSIYTTYQADPAGGAKFTDELEKWWVDEAVPTLRQLSAQISGFIYTQTQMLALTYDGFLFNQYAKIKQQEEYLARKRYTPNEYSCVAASNISALAKARTVTEQLTEALKTEMEKRANGASDPIGSSNASNDIYKRWTNYCSYFKDPDANGGESTCENPETEGSIKNADIDIEGLLLKDTIDMSREDVRVAIMDIFKNLHHNKLSNKQRSFAILTDTGKADLFKTQHIAAIRNTAAHVIASIIARRAPVTYQAISGATSGDLIKDIRLNAGIPEGDGTADNPGEISANPSYNELMLALTKERFLDPTYYIRVQASLPSIQKEQATLEGYVNMQLNDIYQLQEQINTLVAARTTLNSKSHDEAHPGVSGQSSSIEAISTEDASAP